MKRRRYHPFERSSYFSFFVQTIGFRRAFARHDDIVRRERGCSAAREICDSQSIMFVFDGFAVAVPSDFRFFIGWIKACVRSLQIVTTSNHNVSSPRNDESTLYCHFCNLTTIVTSLTNTYMVNSLLSHEGALSHLVSGSPVWSGFSAKFRRTATATGCLLWQDPK